MCSSPRKPKLTPIAPARWFPMKKMRICHANDWACGHTCWEVAQTGSATSMGTGMCPGQGLSPPHGRSQPRTCAKQMVLPALPCQNHPVLAAPPCIPVAAPKLLQQHRDSPARAHPGLPSARSKAGLPGVSLLPIYMHYIDPYMCTVNIPICAL